MSEWPGIDSITPSRVSILQIDQGAVKKEWTDGIVSDGLLSQVRKSTVRVGERNREREGMWIGIRRCIYEEGFGV